jgi:hypothetical protein
MFRYVNIDHLRTLTTSKGFPQVQVAMIQSITDQSRRENQSKSATHTR